MLGKYSLRHQLLRLPALLIFPLTLFLMRLAEKYPAFTESVYSRKAYPRIANIFSSITSAVPFSIAEIAIVLGAAAMLIVFIVRLVKLFRFKLRDLMRFVSLLITYALIAGFLFFAFYALWGLNQFRTPVAESMSLPDGEYSASQLEQVCMELSERAAGYREYVQEDASGVFVYSDGFDAAAQEVADAYAELGHKYELFSMYAVPAKSAMFSEALSYAGIAGIYIPYTFEAHVNTNAPDLYLAFDAAHETAHFLGWVDEYEASFVGFLACLESDDAEVLYSGYMSALNECINQLYLLDEDACARVAATYSDGMRRDLVSYREYLKEYSGSISDTVADINDAYLKFNGQENGIESYSDVVQLILRYFDLTRVIN